MRVFIAVVWQEILERRALVVAAAVASVLPVLAPVLAGTGSNPPEDIREAAMWVMVLGLVPLFALLLGVSFIGRDLGEGRLGFYFAQPLPGPTIWFGKLTAVVLLIWAVKIIIMLPTVVLAPDPGHFFVVGKVLDAFMPKWVTPIAFWVATAAIVLAAHAIGIAWRARSAWLVVDLIALMIVGGAGWTAVKPFFPIVATAAGTTGLLILVTSALVGLIMAGAAQVSSGRIDAHRGHRMSSVTFWSILGIGAFGVLGWSVWVRSAAIEDLDGIHYVSLGPGEWVAVAGVSAGRMDYHPRFLLNVLDGRSVSIGPAVNWRGRPVRFSEDAKRAVWRDFSAFDHWPLMVADLDLAEPQPDFTGIVLDSDWEDFAISPDGERVAVLSRNTIQIHQIDPPEQLMAALIDDYFDAIRLRFDDANSVRILASSSWDDPRVEQGRWHLFHVEVGERRLVEGAEIGTPWLWWDRSREGTPNQNVVKISVGDEDHLAVRNPETGEAAVDLGPWRFWSNLTFLSDGRFAATRREDDGDHFETFTAEGTLIHRVDLPEADALFGGGEVSPGLILIGHWTWEGEYPERTVKLSTSLIDGNTGRLDKTLDAMAPVLGTWGTSSSGGAWAVGSTAGRLLQGEDDSLHLWDPETGELEQLIPVPDGAN